MVVEASTDSGGSDFFKVGEKSKQIVNDYFNRLRFK